jgi:V/A-type H+-transporting ATPase subunit A
VEYPEFAGYITGLVGEGWIEMVNEAKTRLLRGKEIAEQINILGDDGVPVDYHVTFWKSELIDFVVLQQDAFDEVDAVTPLERQQEILNLVTRMCRAEYEFDNFQEVSIFFKKAINLCKQMNYAEFRSAQYKKYNVELAELLATKQVSNE